MEVWQVRSGFTELPVSPHSGATESIRNIANEVLRSWLLKAQIEVSRCLAEFLEPLEPLLVALPEDWDERDHSL